MFFASDNSGPVHPRIFAALTSANDGYAMAYGNDALSRRATGLVREVFEAPEAAVCLVATGTAANALALATLSKPWQTIFCTPESHIHEDECNAPEFFTGGAKLTLVESDGARMTPATLRAAIEAEETRGVHGPQRGPVSVTNVTERGTIYSAAEIAALAEVAGEYGLPMHLDGARFANAVAALGCTPAEMSWKAGVDAVSFGGTKNGCMGVEAVVFFDPAQAWELELRRKRGAHLFSKHRFLAAQMAAYLENGLWLDLAARANAANARLVEGLKALPGVAFPWQPQANITFAALPRAAHERLHEAGAAYHLWNARLEGVDPDEMLEARLVCDWSASEEHTSRFLELARG